MRIVSIIALSLMICCNLNVEDKSMDQEEAKKNWDEYHERIKMHRLAEAKIINAELDSNGITTETELILDFNFFTQDKEGAKGIKEQLSENSCTGP